MRRRAKNQSIARTLFKRRAQLAISSRISALLLGVFFLDESITLRGIAGMALIGVGLAAIDGRVWAAIRKSPPSSVSTSASRAASHDI